MRKIDLQSTSKGRGGMVLCRGKRQRNDSDEEAAGARLVCLCRRLRRKKHGNEKGRQREREVESGVEDETYQALHHLLGRKKTGRRVP